MVLRYQLAQPCIKEILGTSEYPPDGHMPTNQGPAERPCADRPTVRRAVRAPGQVALLGPDGAGGTSVVRPRVVRLLGCRFSVGMDRIITPHGSGGASHRLARRLPVDDLVPAQSLDTLLELHDVRAGNAERMITLAYADETDATLPTMAIGLPMVGLRVLVAKRGGKAVQDATSLVNPVPKAFGAHTKRQAAVAVRVNLLVFAHWGDRASRARGWWRTSRV